MTLSRLRVLCLFGTRPEAIKMAPLVLAMRRSPEHYQPIVCTTGQHREMLDQVMTTFGISADYDLNVMSPDQSLAALSARVIERADEVLLSAKPDIVLVQGDTTTAFAACVAAFYRRVPVGHVEAGLRTGDLRDPFPEEANRVLIDHLADYCFAPTNGNKETLLKEGISSERIFVTGNTGIDALLIARAKIAGGSPDDWPNVWGSAFGVLGKPDTKVVLITMHRRESFGPRLQRIFQSIRSVAVDNPDTHFIYPVHLNPNVAAPAGRILGDVANIHLIEPISYEPFVYLMNRAVLIVTDSGGIQEEAPSIGKPVIVVRETTERQEALEGGFVKLAGTNGATIAALINTSLRESQPPRRKGPNPYGDGKASESILRILQRTPTFPGREAADARESEKQ
jgi:UDP-N-acetylglucosamine 2-epimerase (non-hydrolysing)